MTDSDNDTQCQARSIGAVRQPEVQRTMDEAIGAIRAAGKTVGILVDRNNLQRYVDQGVGFLYIHVNERWPGAPPTSRIS